MPILYVTTDGAKWGAGTGATLSASQIDNNFWQIHERVLDLETNPIQPASISNIQVIGSQLKIFLSDATEFGPYTLPIAAFEWRDDFANGQLYNELDIIKVPGVGLYMSLLDHTAVAPFDPDRVILGDAVYLQLFGEDPYTYQTGPFIPGKPGYGVLDNMRIWGHLIKTDVYFQEDFAGGEFKLAIAPLADLTFPVLRDDTEIGAIFFAAGEVQGVLSTIASGTQVFADGEILGIKKPTAVDDSALELIGTFSGLRGVSP